MLINAIVGCDARTLGIGLNGSIPWHNKEDMRWFKKMTTGHGVVMGYNTYQSIGGPLPNRTNIVLTTSRPVKDAHAATSLMDAVRVAEELKVDELYIIGGGRVYKEALELDMVDTLYVNYMTFHEKMEYDTYFPMHLLDIDKWSEETIGVEGDNRYVMWHRIRTSTLDTPDAKYLSMLRHIIEDGETKDTRAGETLSVFGGLYRFRTHGDRVPMLTTKKMFIKGCLHELLWFLSGDTNIKRLVDNGVHIWDDDAYRFYASHHIGAVSKDIFMERVMDGVKEGDYTYGDLGPVYGKQWTDWDGINQVDELINKLKSSPDDRRMIISAWNVGDFSKMALPPCHFMSQWYTKKMTLEERRMWLMEHHGIETNDLKTLDENGVPTRKLSVMWSQRSVDTCLGFPFNLTSYSILLHMVAHCVNMVPDEVICSLGDMHIYKNQLEGVYTQLLRNPYLYDMPRINLNGAPKDIFSITYNDISIKGYESYPTIKYPLSVGL